MTSLRLASVLIALTVVALPVTASAARSGERWKQVRETSRAGLADEYAKPGSRLFAANSIWNRELPRDAPEDPSSAARVKALADLIELRQGLPASLGGGSANLAGAAFSTPIYRVFALTPRVRVDLPPGRAGVGLRRALAAGVPIPENASQAAGTDGHMTIYQPATDTLWEFWRARREPTGWRAEWGGVMRNVSRSPGYYTGAAVPGLKGADGWNWGSTATSLPVAAGTVTLKELRQGRIDHALAMAVPAPCRDLFTWPAQRTDGTSDAPDCLPAGAHLRLDPDVDVGALRLHPVARMLAQAAQRYGMVVRDRTRVSAQFFLESPPPGSSVYDGLLAGTSPSKVLDGFPWRRLQLVALTPCRRSPCER